MKILGHCCYIGRTGYAIHSKNFFRALSKEVDLKIRNFSIDSNWQGINSKEVIPTPGIIVFPENENIKLHAGPTQSGGASKLWFCNLFNRNFKSKVIGKSLLYWKKDKLPMHHSYVDGVLHRLEYDPELGTILKEVK